MPLSPAARSGLRRVTDGPGVVPLPGKLVGNGRGPDCGLTALNAPRENRVMHDIFRRRHAA
jgi:hypothetical protein